MARKKRKGNLRSTILRSIGILLLIAVVGLVDFVYMRKPSNDRVWEAETAQLHEVILEGDTFTIKNVRDWKYSEEEIIAKDYVERSYNVEDLKQVWFLVEPFGAWEGVAHTFFSFEFENAPPLAFSVEARKEDGEDYSAFLGLFNKYELFYSWGTEEDLLIRRTYYLGNDVHIYPLQISNDGAEELLRTALLETQELAKKPQFYNTLTSNCTNNLARQGNLIKPGLIPRFHYARFITGYADNLLYDLKLIPTGNSFEEIEQRYKITELVNESREAANFSEKIRAGLLQN